MISSAQIHPRRRRQKNFVAEKFSVCKLDGVNRQRLAMVLCFCAAVWVASAGTTNYFCVVCGKGPLTGRIWLHPRGAICDDCEKIQDRCSICGLPVKAGDGHITTGDGRIICKFDKPNVVMTVDQAKDLFEQTRDVVVDLYGRSFALKYPDVTVNLFDVDYWSEKGQPDGLHKFGFASTRKTSDGHCTHEVVMLSGRTREEMTAVAAHEYAHLWINENCPASHRIEGDTIEAICELTAYQLMAQKKLPEMQKRILESPYTEGRIKTLVAVEREGGTDYILNWVKNGTAATLDADANLAPVFAPAPAPAQFSAPPRALPAGLKFSGLMILGKSRLAVINGVSFAAGDQNRLKLKEKTVLVRCREIRASEVVLEVDGGAAPVTLTLDEEKLVP
jgi:hypothetical protein